MVKSEVSQFEYDIDFRGERYFIRVFNQNPILDTRENANYGIKTLLEMEKIIDFLNEVEEQDWELDADDIRQILKNNFAYVRKQYQTTLTQEGSTK